MTRILALDLGTRTGWALRTESGIVGSGAWKLPAADPMRAYAELRSRLTDELSLSHPSLVAYEDVPARAHRGGIAAHRWGGFESVVLLAAFDAGCRIVPVPIQRWKRRAEVAPGSGPAEALEAAKRAYSFHSLVKSADQAVAIWVSEAAWDEERAR